MDKTVTNIVQGLLDQGHISAEEAITLLKVEIEANQNKPGLFTSPYNQPTITFPSPWEIRPYLTTSTDPIECHKQQING
jgi:hypothetical protein